MICLRINRQTIYDAIPEHEVTLRTPYLLHPNWNTERRTFLIMNKGQHKRETQLCVRFYWHLHSNSALHVIIRAKKRGNQCKFLWQNFYFPARKKPNLQNTKQICIFKNMRFILGDFRRNVCSYFFHFCIRHANLVFFATFVCWQVWKSANLLILKTMYSLPKFNLWPHKSKRFWKTNRLV